MDKNEKLIQMYQEANFYLLGLIRSLEEGPTKRRKEQLIRQIHEIIANLSENAAETAREIIEESYKAGSSEAIRQLLAQGIAEEAIEPTLKTVIHVRAVQAIVDETFYRILEANDNMTADVKERIEEVVFRANRRSLIEGVSRRQATKDAIAEMTARGITGITAKNGAQIPIDKYMANVIQYHQRQAHVEGNLNRLAETGQDLVYVNSVGITCDICAKYQGRVYSISGNDDRFPKLTVKPPYHGHCVHSTSAWVEEYQDELDVKKAIKNSNKPFIDSRTEANIRKYEKMQREKSKKNEARKQWIRYKARMPDLPDLKTFASQKARNTKQYEEWQWQYRQINMQIKARKDIISGKYPLKINAGKQNRHIEGTNQYKDYMLKLSNSGYKPSTLEVSPEELLNKFSGKGRIIVSSPNQPPKESVNTGRYIGKYFDSQSNEMINTNWVMICYSKTGSHIYPKKGDEQN